MISSFIFQIAICETSHFYFLRNFQKISPKRKIRVLHFPRVREGMQSPWPTVLWGGHPTEHLPWLYRDHEICLCSCPQPFHRTTWPHKTSFPFLRTVHRTIQMLPDVPVCTAASLGPLGVQSPHTRQLRTAVNIERGGKIFLEITKTHLKMSS